MQADKRVAHFALDFLTRYERCNRVHDHDVQCTRAHQCFGNFQTLLTGIRLGYQQAVDVNAQRTGINRVKGVLGIDECRFTACLLCLRDGVQGNRGLTGRFRSIDLDDSAARQAADAQRTVQTDRTGGNVVDCHAGILAQAHNRALTILFFNQTQRLGQGLLFVGRRGDRLQLLFIIRRHK